jgi:hypothetical protein
MLFGLVAPSVAPRDARSRLRSPAVRFGEFVRFPAWTRSLSSPVAAPIPRIFRIMEPSAVTARTMQGKGSGLVLPGSGMVHGCLFGLTLLVCQ